MRRKLTAPKTENDIVKHWIYTDKIYTSVICITYNQEFYIRDAIDSFLAQVTDYKFEIIIHDDASTDSTREILKEYQSKYPSIVKLIFQDENQFSKNINLPFKHAVSEVGGKYTALCEGDDFWIDRRKLQKQINILNMMKEYNFIFSRAISLYPDGDTSYFCDLGNTQKVLSFSECIIGPKSTFYPTASFFFRTNIIKRIPDWFYNDAPVGDYYLQLFASEEKGAIYIPDATSVYRRDSLNSYSVNMKNRNKIDAVYFKFIDCTVKLNKRLNKKYHKDLYTRLKTHSIRAIFNSKNNDFIAQVKLFILVCINFPPIIVHYISQILKNLIRQ